MFELYHLDGGRREKPFVGVETLGIVGLQLIRRRVLSRRRPTRTAPAENDVTNDFAELRVDDTVQDEVGGEVDKEQRVRGRYDVLHRLGVVLVSIEETNEVDDVIGCHEERKHDDDRDECRSETMTGSGRFIVCTVDELHAIGAT